MGRNLLDGDLTADNIDTAKVEKGVDPIETLRRIGREWLQYRTPCACSTNEACSVCEIDYLLEEMFRLPENRVTQ